MATAKKTAKKTVKKTANTAKKATAKTVDTAEKNTINVIEAARKGALAYVGLYGAAYERASKRWSQLRSTTDGLFDQMVERGEVIESKAGDIFKSTQAKVSERFEEGTEKVKSILPASANDRVEELETEIKALNKKIVALGKKATTSAKAKMKTEKTSKAKKAA